MKQDLSQIDLQEFSSAIENALKMTSIETKIVLLEGLISRFRENIMDINTSKIYNDGSLIFCNTWIVTKPVFFYQDYSLLTDELIKVNYKVEVERKGVFEYTPIFLFREEKELKREYLLFAAVTNELIRLRKQKKGKWKGKVHVPMEDSSPLILNQEQEDKVIELYKKYWEFGINGVTRYQYVTMVCNFNLSSLNVSKQKKKLYSLVRELCEVLGDSWGEKTAFNTTNGEKDLKSIKKNYYNF
ncbi:MAG: hypothetical protein MJ204_01485 [Bacteroidales bacterium]|nr:hypothetical protein [Bacteroidales bacterium]